MKNMVSGVVNSLNSIHIAFNTNEIISGERKSVALFYIWEGLSYWDANIRDND